MTLRTLFPAEGLRNAARRFNLVVLSEGFLVGREEAFFAQVTKFKDRLLVTSPFHRFPALLTVSGLFKASNQSLRGIGDDGRCAWRPLAPPGAAGDKMASTFDTAFGALYCRTRDSLGTPIPRSLWGATKKVTDAIAAEASLATLDVRALVLVDNDADGGSASDGIAWFALSDDWIEVAIHELGHSAFALADEYDIEGPARHAQVEPSEPNVTIQRDRASLLAAWEKNPQKLSLPVWHDLIDPATPLPTSLPNAVCQPLSKPESQRAKPGVAADVAGLFEGADRSPCDVFRPRLACRMRNRRDQFCPVCEFAIDARLARVDDPLRRISAATVPGAWTAMTPYHEPATRVPPGDELARLVFYAASTGAYEIRDGMLLPPTVFNTGVQIDPFWTTLLSCEIGDVPHLLAHSLPARRFAIYEVIDDAGKPKLELRFDTGLNGSPFTHIATFVSRGLPHFIGYTAATGALEISRIDSNAAAPQIVFGTALDPTALWQTAYTLITTFTVDGVPHVLKHKAHTGEVHVQSLDPPGPGPHTFISRPGHWSPGATVAIGYENGAGRTFVRRTSSMNYEAFDWVFPGGTGVERLYRRQRLDITAAMALARGKTSAGFRAIGFIEVAALDLVSNEVRMLPTD